MDDAQVVVPQNLAVAANYDCYRCITAADRQPARAVGPRGAGGGAAPRARRGVGAPARVRAVHHQYTLAEITAQLDGFKEEIMDIMADAPVIEPSPALVHLDAVTGREHESVTR